MNLYLRLIGLMLRLPFMARRALLEPARLRLRVWPNDCDLNLHLNNGRYLTFMDLGRVHLITQIGLLGALVQRRWAPVLSAAEMNFIRPLRPLHAVGMVKGLFLHGRERVESRAVLAALGLEMAPPALPEVVRHWNDLAALKKQHLG